ncbi:MAG: acyl-CoA dehydrogenase family protein [Phenylobacterium sp.]|jgi:alkylation response protein AidB-like acyl-CoA dehydrogenase|uniref:acyl-CoA dehydrogenase family protein n=2 Tax=Phenylobacterium sp. TaxID=1871053 RepID=UPI0025FE2C21|nr:acyl-CoA dehydrogenase family protein [Phenylobacterium sp.]MCA3713848.1 acyl-CoA dehydrogenase family protein [Phenylobacterium sp.]MCA3732553.1 acyl-CoA dehydrogenase family protein [Phenylobacterium sp.]MCA3737846.1 acyl-CoA dehydrogenase family protein [Phenylobacterium sp.]MCA3746076.1 acyl-CoA dehydrogenase family protein [Phenylobacterium sp.]MCA3757797.1 acyl-CoA dehydrogenase family protein [Phenylobacterium sp.]
MAVLNEEQSMLRDAAKSWTQEKSPVTAFRKMRDSGVEIGYDVNAWNEMAEMGWAGVIIPEEYGGSAFGYLSMGLILEELGRTLTASPLIASGVGAASALVLGGSDAQKSEWLPKIADGSVVGALAVDEGPHHAPEKVALAATKSGAGYSLSGTKTFVIEGLAANLLVVSARTSGKPGDKDGITLFLVPADAKGVSRKRLALADSRGAANITFDKVEVGADAMLGAADKGWDVLEKTLDRVRAALAAEMLGAANQAFETTLDYLKVRVQFGQVIGSFQALQHRAAKMFTDLELARSAVEAALQAIDADSPDVPELVSLSKAKMGDVFHLVSNEMVQMHGGIGMTDAHDAGFYLKRARAAEAAFGSQSYHRDRYARINGY